MAINQTRAWLICYDIADHRRLGRVHRCVKKHAIPIQYSVYLAQVSTNQIKDILKELEHIIDPKHDDIRIYPIPKEPNITLIGQAPLIDDLELIDEQDNRVLTMLKNKTPDIPPTNE